MDIKLPKSNVKQRLEDFERKNKEIAKGRRPSKNKKVTWLTQAGHGRFKKVVQDARGPAPKKTLSDLP